MVTSTAQIKVATQSSIWNMETNSHITTISKPNVTSRAETKDVNSFQILGFLLWNTNARFVTYANATPAVQRIITATCIMSGFSTSITIVQTA